MCGKERKVINYTDHRKFRNDLDAYLNAGVNIVVLHNQDKLIKRIILGNYPLKARSRGGGIVV